MTVHIAVRWLVLTTTAVALVALPGAGQAEPSKPQTPPAPDDAQPSWTPPEWCAHRPTMHVVMGYDEGKNFGFVEERAVAATDRFSQTLCPGDRVRLAEFGIAVHWLHKSAITIEGPDDLAEVVKTFEQRKRPSDPASVNDILIKSASSYWEEQLAEGELPVLMVFTDTLHSDAPRRRYVMDFAWDAVPPYFQGQFLTIVNLLERSDPRPSPTLHLATAPPSIDLAALPTGGRTTYRDIMETFIPPPTPPEPRKEVILKTVVEDRTPPWLKWLNTFEGTMMAGGAFFLMGLLIFWAGRLSRRRRKRSSERAATPSTGREVTLVLRDHLHTRVLRQETRLIRDTLRVAPASNADFVIPGPYAFEVLEEGGEQPLLRSANMLGVEIRRAGRRLSVPEGEQIALRPGDRVNIGAGHEVEVQYG